MTAWINRHDVIQQLVDRLRVSCPDVSPDTATTVVRHNHARFDGRPVGDLVPLLVERGRPFS